MVVTAAAQAQHAADYILGEGISGMKVERRTAAERPLPVRDSLYGGKALKLAGATLTPRISLKQFPVHIGYVASSA
jgi:hypothetical protein